MSDDFPDPPVPVMPTTGARDGPPRSSIPTARLPRSRPPASMAVMARASDFDVTQQKCRRGLSAELRDGRRRTL